jgi:glycosyltransferase involved in cell wall biosynthesis
MRADWPLPEAIEAHLAAADLAVYHVSNDLEDREIYELAISWPGLVVLHDLVLDRLVLGLLRARDPLGVAGGREALAAAPSVSMLASQGPLSVPWCAHLVRRARGVVVHSAFAAGYLEAMGCRTPVFVAPHPRAADPPGIRRVRRDALRFRRRLGAARVIGVVGELGPEMQLPVVLEAAARLDAHPVVVGRRVAGYEIRAEVRRLAGERATIVPDPRPSEAAAWVRACDLVVDVRSPSRAEVDGLLVRALQLGVPVVAGPVGSHVDWPPDAVLRLGDGPHSVQDLARAVRPLLQEPETRARMAAAGGAIAARMGAEAPAAYRQAVSRTMSLVRDPVRWSLARWGRSLHDVGVDRTAAARGHGRDYAQALAELAGTDR